MEKTIETTSMGGGGFSVSTCRVEPQQRIQQRHGLQTLELATWRCHTGFLGYTVLFISVPARALGLSAYDIVRANPRR